MRSLEGLRERRDNILLDIKKEEERKNEIEKYIMKLKEELEALNGKFKMNLNVNLSI